METFASFMNTLWSILTVVAQVLSVMILVYVFVKKDIPVITGVSRRISEKAVLFSFILALLSTIGSLIYSDVIGYEPCKLCWFQRIFMYPLVILLGLALIKKDNSVLLKTYALALALGGGVVALFHYVGQLGWNPFGLECLAIGQSASCNKNFVLEFGYVTIPLMSLSVFILIAVSLYASIKKQGNNTQ